MYRMKKEDGWASVEFTYAPDYNAIRISATWKPESTALRRMAVGRYSTALCEVR
jgi:hypothetical protein